MLKLRTLGGLSVENAVFIGGAAARRRPLAVLAILAVEGQRGLGRDKICALLWPEADQERSSASLRQALTTLRSELRERNAILGTAELRLNPEVIVSDVEQFEQHVEAREWRKAVELYGGTFLDGVFLKNAPEFEHWVDAQRARLAHRYANALEELAKAATDAGDHTGAITWWRKLSHLDPGNARIGLGLMTAFVDSGDPAAALQHFRVIETVLREEYNAHPPRELATFAARIAQGNRSASIGSSAQLANESPPAISSTIDEIRSPTGVAPQLEPTMASAENRSSPARNTHWLRTRTGLAAIAAVALLSAALLAWRLRPVRIDSRRVVVAVLQNETGDPALDVVGRIAADWLAQGLARTGLVDVVDSRALRRTIAADTGTLKPASDLAAMSRLARATGASAVVWGAYYRTADSLQFHVEIADPENGIIKHALDRTAAPVSDPTVALDQMRQSVMGVFAAASDPRFAAWATRATHPPRYDAYQAYVRGLDASAGDGENAESSLAGFLEAARLDTGFVDAILHAFSNAYDYGHTKLADSLLTALQPRREQLAPFDRADLDVTLGFIQGRPEESYEAARRMVRLAPGSQDAHFRLGWAALNSRRYRESAAEFQRVLDLPGSMLRWVYFNFWLTQSYHALGDHASELREIRRARERFPRDPQICALELRALIGARRLDEFTRVFSSCDSLQPPGGGLNATMAQELRGHGYAVEAKPYFERAREMLVNAATPRPNVVARQAYLMGRWSDALAFFEPAARSPSADVQVVGMVGVCAAILGDTTAARAMRERLERRASGPPAEIAQNLMWRGRISLLLGDRENGVELLRQSFEHGISAAAFFHLDPTRILLNGYAPYDKLLKSRD